MADGLARADEFGETVFWYRREKVWALIDHYQKPDMDTLMLMGDIK